MTRHRYVYRLDAIYPEGSQDGRWEPEGWDHDPYTDFFWPAVRNYLSARAAHKRATLLRKYGAIVDVVRSEPITFPQATNQP